MARTIIGTPAAPWSRKASRSALPICAPSPASEKRKAMGNCAWSGLISPLPTEIGRAHVELQSLMRISYAVFCLKKKKITTTEHRTSLIQLNSGTNIHIHSEYCNTYSHNNNILIDTL